MTKFFILSSCLVLMFCAFYKAKKPVIAFIYIDIKMQSLASVPNHQLYFEIDEKKRLLK